MTREQIEADLRVCDQVIGTGRRADGEPFAWEAVEFWCRTRDRLRADLAKLDGPADGFVRVRIGVSVDEHGNWCADGSRAFKDDDEIREFMEGAETLSEGDSFAIVTADVRKPMTPLEVEGTVTP